MLFTVQFLNFPRKKGEEKERNEGKNTSRTKESDDHADRQLYVR